MLNLQNNMTTASPLGQVSIDAGPSPKYARPADWNRVRPIFKRLYVDEDKTLKEVITIMANDYGHRGTVKMYKSRIEKWCFDKNVKEDEARAIVRKKTQRDAVGKKSVFRVRGRDVAMADIMRYFRRKGILHPETVYCSARPPTPPAIECLTPATSPSPHDAWDPADEEIQREMDRLSPSDMEINSIPGVMAMSSMQAPNPNQAYLSPDLIYHILFSDPKIPRSPLPPQSLVESEKLFAAIRAYFAGALESEMFITCDYGFLVNRDGYDYEKSHVKFFELCDALANDFLKNKKSFAEGRRCLSKALNLVGKILRHQHPRALEHLSQALIVLQDYPEIVTMLRNQFSSMVAIFFAEGHPWRQIFTQLCTIDHSQLKHVINQSGICNYEVLAQSVGRFHPTSLYLYSTSVLRQLTPSDAVVTIASLLEQAKQEFGGTKDQIMELKHEYGYQLFLSERDEEAVIVLEGIIAAYRLQKSPKGLEIISSELLAMCHYHMDHVREAELSVREAIEMCEEVYGKDDTLNLSMKARLEKWLREWGRETEAEKLRAEILELIGLDEIDMEGMTI